MESRQHLDTLSMALTEANTAVHAYLKSINALLLKAACTTKAAVAKYLIQPYTVNEQVAPGKKKETQPKFHATCKPSGRKRKGSVLK